MKKTLDNNFIKDYSGKELEFWIYSYPYKTDESTLKDYNIRGVNIRHEGSLIRVSFRREDSIIGVGLAMEKYSNVLENGIKDLSLVMECKGWRRTFKEGEGMEVIMGKEGMDFSIVIESRKHRLEEQKNYIPYYNVNDEYEDVVLEEILEGLPSIWGKDKGC